MIKFMFGVLGSSMFWLIYFAISLFIGTLIFRKLFPNVFEFFTTGSCKVGGNGANGGIGYFEVISSCIIIYIGWPVIIILYTTTFIIKFLFMDIFKRAIIYIDKHTPEFKIVKK